MTGGEGSFTLEFSRYEVVPAHLQEDIVARHKRQQDVITSYSIHYTKLYEFGFESLSKMKTEADKHLAVALEIIGKFPDVAGL